MIGLLGCIAVIIQEFEINKNNIFIILTTLLIVLLSLRTMVRNTNWVNPLSLYSHDESINNDNYSLENNYGVELIKLGNFDEALIHVQRSIALQPKWGTNWATAGIISMKQKKYSKSIYYFEHSLKNDGGNFTAFYYLIHTLIVTGDYQSAKNWSDQALLSFPNNGPLIELQAITQYNLGNQEKALELEKKAIDLQADPQAQFIYDNMVNKQQINFDN